MNRLFKRLNILVKQVKEETGKEVVAIRVFDNCLCLYFAKGSCRFYSKQGLNWGKVGAIYFPTDTFNRNSFSKRLVEQFNNLIGWTEEYISANPIQRLWLLTEYRIKYI